MTRCDVWNNDCVLLNNRPYKISFMFAYNTAKHKPFLMQYFKDLYNRCCWHCKPTGSNKLKLYQIAWLRRTVVCCISAISQIHFFLLNAALWDHEDVRCSLRVKKFLNSWLTIYHNYGYSIAIWCTSLSYYQLSLLVIFLVVDTVIINKNILLQNLLMTVSSLIIDTKEQ